MPTNMRQISSSKAVFVVLIALCATFASGQGIVTGAISGTVQDAQGAVIAGAAVQAIQTGTNAEFTTLSNSQGYFQISNLPIGTYAVLIEAPRFSKLQVSNVAVDSGKNNSLGAHTLPIPPPTEP